MRCFKVFFVVSSLFLCASVSADQSVCGGGQVLVNVAVGQAVEVIVENGVGDLVRAGDPSTLKVEHTSGHLFFTPLGLSPAEVTVIDVHGRSHLIRWVFGQTVDRKVTIRDCAIDEKIPARQDAVMGLMRALILSRPLAGATQKDIDEIVFDDGRVRMRAVLVYQMPKLWGYVMRVENLTAGPVVIPIQRISFPGLLAVSSSKDVLAHGESADIHMVVNR